MKVPESLAPLVENGLVEQVVRALKSGKEAQVYLVRGGGELKIAKIYKDASQRSFKNRAAYTEGRRVKSSRDERAMKRRSSYGRARDEASWRVAESEIIATLFEAGVTVPKPHTFFEGVLLMEFITDAHGEPAPRLAEAELGPLDKERAFEQVLKEIVMMLVVDIVHGDLSTFNILWSNDRAVIIDFPQAVDATANAQAQALLTRDVDNLTVELLGHRPDHAELNYGEEIWDLYKRGELTAEVELTGRYKAPEIDVDTENILAEIAFFEEQERRKREALGEPGYAKKKRKGAPPQATKASSEPATGHEEMERVAREWEQQERRQQSDESSSSRRRRRGRSSEERGPNDQKSASSAEDAEPRRRGRPKRRGRGKE